jgi:hypothetical protein
VFEPQIAGIRHKIDVALKTTVGALIALTGIVVALGFFSAALFLWIEARYGAIEAALILGGAYVALALIALIAIAVVQRRKPPLPPPAAATTARAPWWTNPAVLMAGLDVSRALGRRRGVTVGVLLAAFVIGALLPRASRRDKG